MSPSSTAAGAAVVQVPAFGTTAVVAVRRPGAVAAAEEIVRRHVDEVDRACSRFRPDAEVVRLAASGGRFTVVSDTLFDYLDAALRVAVRTGGLVDPTVGNAVCMLGYDRNFSAIPDDAPGGRPPLPAPGWELVELDHGRRRVRVPPGLVLDLGATAKALAADRIAAAVAGLDTGTVVSIGGDVAIDGPAPDGGWPVGVAADSGAPAGDVDEVVSLTHGGLASSSTTVRRWRRGGVVKHHIVDPHTGDSAAAFWRLVTVAAGTCLDANAASTAAVLWGRGAPARLAALELPARLVRHDGVVVHTPRWPRQSASPGHQVAS